MKCEHVIRVKVFGKAGRSGFRRGLFGENKPNGLTYDLAITYGDSRPNKLNVINFLTIYRLQRRSARFSENMNVATPTIYQGFRPNPLRYGPPSPSINDWRELQGRGSAAHGWGVRQPDG